MYRAAALLSRPPTLRGVSYALNALRNTLGDANVPAIWWGQDAAKVTVAGGLASNVTDARGAGFGTALTGSGTGRPAYDPTTGLFTFNGTANFLRADSWTSGITANCGVVIIATPPAITDASDRKVFDLSAAAGSTAMTSTVLATTSTVDLAASGEASHPTLTYVGLTGLRVLHARRTAGVLGLQLGSGVEQTASNAETDVTVTRFTLAASRADSPATFLMTTVSAVLVYLGDYTAAAHVAVNQFALSLGATL